MVRVGLSRVNDYFYLLVEKVNLRIIFLVDNGYDVFYKILKNIYIFVFNIFIFNIYFIEIIEYVCKNV